MEPSIILPIQIEKLTLVTWDIDALGVAYDGHIKVLDDGCDVRLDRVGYPSCGGAFRAGASLGRTALGLVALWLFRALYLDQLPTMKHNGVFLGRGVCEIYLLLLAHCFHFFDGPFREIRLMSTIALEG
jgi:hypothetical protein